MFFNNWMINEEYNMKEPKLFMSVKMLGNIIILLFHML